MGDRTTWRHELTAAQRRAAEVLFQATKAAMRGVEGYDSWLAIGQAQVAALMAHPDLLVDLAIEAGVLVALSDRFAWKRDPDFAGCAIVNVDGPNGRGGDNWQPLYRRATQENDQ